MEQKKILWIIVAVSSFLLIIFATALFLYSPSKSTSSGIQQAALTPNRTAAGTASAEVGNAVSAASDTGGTPLSPEAQSDTAGGSASGATETVPADPDAWVKDPASAPGPGNPVQSPPQQINLTIVNADTHSSQYNAIDVSRLAGKGPAPEEPVAEPSRQSEAPRRVESTSTAEKATQPARSISAAPQSATPTRQQAEPAPRRTQITEYWIQTGSFTDKLNAEKARDTLKARYMNAEIFTRETKGKIHYRVRVGPYKAKSEAEYWLASVKAQPDFATSYVSEVKTSR